jgi:hypothetical protein
MTKNKKESHYLILMMKSLLNYPDTHSHTHTHSIIALLCTVLYSTALLSSVNDEEQKGISLSDLNDEKPT